MVRKLFQLIFVTMVLLTAGCIKDTYDMNMLSKSIHISPAINISAIKGDISLSDMVESNDTLVFDKNNLVKIVIKQDSIFNLTVWDFLSLKSINNLSQEKGFGQLMASFEPDSINLEIEDILKNLTGDIDITNPSVRLYYSNSFSFPVKMKLDAAGKRRGYTPVNLDLDTFALSFTNEPEMPDITDSIIINNANSSIAEIFSLPPEEIHFSGTAMMDTLGKKDSYLSSQGRILGSLEIEVPMEFRINNLQFADTVDNFLDEAFDEDSDISWDDFELFKVNFKVKNGFPMGVSLTMSLYDSINRQIINSIDASEILNPAPVDGNGKASGVTETTTSIEFTKEFFSSIKLADKIILKFTLNTTDNGSTDVKIYSDYRIDFNASLVMKADYNFRLE